MKHSREILELFSKFFQAAQTRKIPLKGIEGETFTLEPYFEEKSSGSVKDYRIAVVHNGFFLQPISCIHPVFLCELLRFILSLGHKSLIYYPALWNY